MKINGEQRVKGNIYVVDSCFFKMFPAKILDGDAMMCWQNLITVLCHGAWPSAWAAT